MRNTRVFVKAIAGVLALSCCNLVYSEQNSHLLPTANETQKWNKELLKKGVQLAAIENPVNVYCCSKSGTEDDYDLFVFPFVATVSTNCISPSELQLTAEQWANKIGLEVYTNVDEFYWLEGVGLGSCFPNPDVRYYPNITTTWSTDIDPSVPGYYTLTVRVQAQANCNGQGGFIFDFDKTAECKVKVLPSSYESYIDTDRDGLSDFTELDLFPLSSSNAFTHSEGVLDSVRARTGRDVSDGDFDLDGFWSTFEKLKGSSMFHADSDYDGVNDDADDYPLDSSRTSSGSSSSDTAAPVVTISTPSV